MNYSFEEQVSKIMDTAIKVEIDANYQKKIQDFVDELIEVKKEEHKNDNKQEAKRFFTGFIGEASLEKLFNIPIIDWSIGESLAYQVPDIPGYNVGIKTVEYGKFPIIYKKNDYPQIICVADTENRGTVYICGLATPEVLNTYQDVDLILSPYLRAKGIKTGFYGFEYLTPVKTLEDIKAYKETIFRKVADPNQKTCPECEKPLVVRSGKYGKFWGCTGFPSCKHTEKYTEQV